MEGGGSVESVGGGRSVKGESKRDGGRKGGIKEEGKESKVSLSTRFNSIIIVVRRLLWDLEPNTHSLI